MPAHGYHRPTGVTVLPHISAPSRIRVLQRISILWHISVPPRISILPRIK